MTFTNQSMERKQNKHYLDVHLMLLTLTKKCLYRYRTLGSSQEMYRHIHRLSHTFTQTYSFISWHQMQPNLIIRPLKVFNTFKQTILYHVP